MSSGSVVQANAVNAITSERMMIGRNSRNVNTARLSALAGVKADFAWVISLLPYRDGVDFADDVAGVD